MLCSSHVLSCGVSNVLLSNLNKRIFRVGEERLYIALIYPLQSYSEVNDTAALDITVTEDKSGVRAAVRFRQISFFLITQ